MSSEDGSPHSGDAHGTGKDKKKRTWVRGKHSTPEKRAKQFPESFHVRGDTLWCSICACVVDFKEKSTATKHLKSDTHGANLEKKKFLVVEPGPSISLTPDTPPVSNSMCFCFLPFQFVHLRPIELEANGSEITARRSKDWAEGIR